MKLGLSASAALLPAVAAAAQLPVTEQAILLRELCASAQVTPALVYTRDVGCCEAFCDCLLCSSPQASILRALARMSVCVRRMGWCA